jgi:hypothetical protein
MCLVIIGHVTSLKRIIIQKYKHEWWSMPKYLGGSRTYLFFRLWNYENSNYEWLELGQTVRGGQSLKYMLNLKCLLINKWWQHVR